MNAQHLTPVPTNVRHTRVLAFWIGLSILLISAVIVTTVLSRTAPTASPKHSAARPALFNPNVPISGTGSAYDGRDYQTVRRPALFNPNVPISGTCSAYSGQ